MPRPERAGDPGRRPHAAPAGGERRAAIALWVTLALLVALRAALASGHSMWGWGANLLRFGPPAPGWTLWALGALALFPFIAQRLAPLARAAGDALAAPGARAWLAAGLLALGATAFVWSHPDRTSFVGDSMLRIDAARAHSPYTRMFPQALPLDTFLHSTLSDWAERAFHVDPRLIERALGALKAAGFVLIAIAFARGIGAGGVATLAIALIAASCMALGLFTGYAKGLGELCLVTAAAIWLGVRVARTSRGVVTLGVVITLGLCLHRGALALLAPWVAALVLGLRGRRPSALETASIAAPPLALAVQLPHLMRIAATVDRLHVAPAGSPGIFAAAFAPLHLLDLANLTLLIAPLAPAVALVALLPRDATRRPERLVLMAAAIPWLLVMLLVHPRQELVRDWDVFAAAGVALSFLIAAEVGETLRRADPLAWLGVPAILIAAAPVITWIACQADLARGLAYARATIEERPPRSKEYRARTLHYLGDMETRLGDFDRAAPLLEAASDLGPSDAFIKAWANAELARGNVAGAARATRRLARLYPQKDAFDQLSRMEYGLGNLEAARAAALDGARIAPGDSAMDLDLRVLGLTWADTLRQAKEKSP